MPIPTDIRVHFEHGEPPILCQSPEELDVTLNQLHAQRLDEVRSGAKNPLQVLIAFADHEINLGLGSEQSFVMIGTKPFDNWYSATNDQDDDGDETWFDGFNRDTYWPANLLVPIDVAREAVRFFVNHQQLSPLINWTE